MTEGEYLAAILAEMKALRDEVQLLRAEVKAVPAGVGGQMAAALNRTARATAGRAQAS